MKADFGPVDWTLAKLVLQNRVWKHNVDRQDPTFFKRGAEKQEPKVFWIGCVDSRVPESVILGCMPGEIFTHRNVANQVQLSDPSGMSALVYAIAELGVDHIIVAGHTRCGGVGICIDEDSPEKAACFAAEEPGRAYSVTEPRETSNWPPPKPLDVWLAPLRELSLSMQPNPPTVLELATANVKKQVENVAKADVVRDAWAGTGKGKRGLAIHGWLYHLEDGLVQDLHCSIWGKDVI